MITPSPWFDLNNLIWIGPSIGVLEAAWGGAIGLLSWAYVRKGRGQALVYGHLYVGLIAALGLMLAGGLGAVQGQPHLLWICLCALGAPLLVAAISALVGVRQSYRVAELRRMQALEL
jgi:peptidoglycan/LPS O-acetylase OafA/YrhL